MLHDRTELLKDREREVNSRENRLQQLIEAEVRERMSLREQVKAHVNGYDMHNMV